jgi:hypothetical protein
LHPIRKKTRKAEILWDDHSLPNVVVNLKLRSQI